MGPEPIMRILLISLRRGIVSIKSVRVG